MASVCYTWNNSPFAWINARLTWKDFCVIQSVLTSKKSVFGKKRKWYEHDYKEKEDKENKEEEIISEEKIENLTEIEKNAFINLIFSMENKESNFLKESTKKKNSNILIDIKDVEIKKTKSNKIIIKINFDEI